MLHECQKLNASETGDCKVTSGYKLLSNYVFDTVRSRNKNDIKGTISGLRQFLAVESSLQIMKNSFYFISKTLVLKLFRFLSSFFGHVTKWLD